MIEDRARILNLIGRGLAAVGHSTESSNVEDELERLVAELEARRAEPAPPTIAVGRLGGDREGIAGGRDRSISVISRNRYPLSPSPIFWTIQGEGHLRGFQMAFVRLAGCSVGCENCDTDYSVAERASAEEIAGRVAAIMPAGDRDHWVWVTGGEPTDHELRHLLAALKGRGYSTAVATSGVRRVIPPVDWLSVSPHGVDPARFQQRYGNELKLVDGLGGLDPRAWLEAFPDSETDFMYRYVQPAWDLATDREDPASMARCLAFLRDNPRWALSRQDHKSWGVA